MPGYDMSEDRDKMRRLAEHKPVTAGGGLSCTCGAQFVGTPEERAAQYLKHRRYPLTVFAQTTAPVPDDKPALGTATIKRRAATGGAETVFEGVVSMRWNSGAIEIEQDGALSIIPGETIWFAKYEEG